MTMTDPIGDMLTRIRNGSKARLHSVSMPSSKFKKNIAAILKKEGYLEDWTTQDAKVGQTLTLTLRFWEGKTPAISGIRRISKPGLRIFCGVNDLPHVFGGLGICIVSTSSGLLTGKEAKKKGVGGEVLAYVW